MSKWDEQANQICRSASSSGRISQTDANILRRSFGLLGDAAKATVKALDQAVIHGAVKIIKDGSGFFDSDGRRIGD